MLNLKHTFEQVWSDLRKAYKTDDGYSLRSRWYGLKCTAATLNGYLQWLTMLRERIGDVSGAEEKTCFMKALPAQLQKAALKKDEDGCLKLEALKDHLQKWLERGEAREALQLNLNEPSPTNVVHTASDDVDVVFSRQKRGGARFVKKEKTSPASTASAPVRQTANRFGNHRSASVYARKCFNCGEAGHLIASCPKPKRQNGRPGQFPQKFKKHCSFCDKEGHVEQDCFAKQRKFQQSGTKPSASGQLATADRMRHRSA